MPIKYSVRIGAVVAAVIAALAALDLYINYKLALIPELNDGIGCHTVFARFLFRTERWSFDLFRNSFIAAAVVAALLTVAAVAIFVVTAKKKKD